MLIERLRALALQGSELATAQVDTLRIKRRIRLYLASNLTQRADFRARKAPAALTMNDEAAHGRRDDTRMARNPSWGGGWCARKVAEHSGSPARKHYCGLGMLTVGPQWLGGPCFGECVRYAG